MDMPVILLRIFVRYVRETEDCCRKVPFGEFKLSYSSKHSGTMIEKTQIALTFNLQKRNIRIHFYSPMLHLSHSSDRENKPGSICASCTVLSVS